MGTTGMPRPPRPLLQMHDVPWKLKDTDGWERKPLLRQMLVLGNNYPPDREGDRKSIFIFFQQLKGDHASKIC